MVNLRLKIALLEAGVDGQDLAAQIERHETHFSKQLNGTRPFSADDRAKIAKILRRPERDLFPDLT